MKLNEILTFYRKENKISFDILAERTGIPKSTLQKVFTGVTVDPGFELVRRIAHGLGITVDTINSAIQSAPTFSPEALDLARKYDQLDTHGKLMVNLVVDEEATRVQQYGKLCNPMSVDPTVDELEANAAALSQQAAGHEDAAADS